MRAAAPTHRSRAGGRSSWGPGLALDTDRFFVVCSNVLGSCHGSTGPSSLDPRTRRPYALDFPSVTIEDMVGAQRLLVRHLGIERLHAAVGSSMGGMQSLAYAALFPGEVANIVSILAAARSSPWSIAIRFIQRQAVLADPDWNGGNFTAVAARSTGCTPRASSERSPTAARENGGRASAGNGRGGVPPSSPTGPASGPPAGAASASISRSSRTSRTRDKFARSYDANSYLYVSKAMDLFDLG